MIEVFKTNIQSQYESKVILEELNFQFPDYAINFDLEDCDKILRVEATTIQLNAIIEILKNKNFNCQILE